MKNKDFVSFPPQQSAGGGELSQLEESGDAKDMPAATRCGT